MKHFTIFLMSLVTAAAASATEPISVRVAIAPRIVDGAPLRAAVTIDSNASLHVAAPVGLFDEYPESLRAHQAGRRLAARQ